MQFYDYFSIMTIGWLHRWAVVDGSTQKNPYKIVLAIKSIKAWWCWPFSVDQVVNCILLTHLLLCVLKCIWIMMAIMIISLKMSEKWEQVNELYLKSRKPIKSSKDLYTLNTLDIYMQTSLESGDQRRQWHHTGYPHIHIHIHIHLVIWWPDSGSTQPPNNSKMVLICGAVQWIAEYSVQWYNSAQQSPPLALGGMVTSLVIK